MKKVFLFLLLASLIGCKSRAGLSKSNEASLPKLVKLQENQIDNKQKNRAYVFGKRILNSCNANDFKGFRPSEASPTIIKNTTKTQLTKTCMVFNEKYGCFIDLKLKEVLQNPESKTTIYRYKANYENTKANKELQVTMNNANKMVALKSRDWTRKYR